MMVFDEVAPGGPNKIFALISYPNSSAYLSSQRLEDDAVYQRAAASYHAIPVEKPIYNRFSSSLLHAFDGMKQMLQPVDCLLYTSPSPRDLSTSRMPSSA